MQFQLQELTRRARNPRRSVIPIRSAAPPATLATDLYLIAYADVVTAWTNAIPRIMAQYERALAGMTTDSPADVDAELGQVEQSLSRLFLILRPRLERWALMVERWQRGSWRGAVLSATGVDLGTMLGPADVRETLETAIARNVALVKDVSSEAQRRISNAVFDGLTNRRPARDVAKQVLEATGMARRRALNAASDQLSKVTSALAEERRREAGMSAWRWKHSGKRHPRQVHLERDGNLYSDDPARVGQEVEGERVLSPPDDRPSQLPFCGCRSAGVLVLNWMAE